MPFALVGVFAMPFLPPLLAATNAAEPTATPHPIQLCVDASGHGLTLQPQTTPPPLSEGGLLFHPLGCSLCGTDAEKLAAAKVPEGTVLGHEVVGTVASIHPNAPSTTNGDTLAVGDRIVVAHHVPCGDCHYCLNQSPSMCRTFKASNLLPGGFASVVSVSAAHIAQTTFRIPSHISNREALCIEPVACILRGLRRLPPRTQGRVGVVGLGFIGLVAAQLLKQQGDVVIGVDKLPARLHLASVAGYVDASLEAAEPERLAPQLAPFLPQGCDGLDAVVLTILTPQSLAMALGLLREGGSLLLLAGSPQAVPLVSNALYYKEISLITSYSPSLEDLHTAAHLICTRQLSLTPLLTHEFPITEFQAGLEAYRKQEALKVYYRLPPLSTESVGITSPFS